MSKKYPDLVEQLPNVSDKELLVFYFDLIIGQCIKESTKSFVLDAEAVAIDHATGKLMPFQELSRRKRKDVKVEDIQVRVCLFAFDLLYLNGEVRNSALYHICSFPCSQFTAIALATKTTE
jgi:DNA ligase-1